MLFKDEWVDQLRVLEVLSSAAQAYLAKRVVMRLLLYMRPQQLRISSTLEFMRTPCATIVRTGRSLAVLLVVVASSRLAASSFFEHIYRNRRKRDLVYVHGGQNTVVNRTLDCASDVAFSDKRDVT